MSRAHALLDLLVGFDANRTMIKTLEVLAKGCRGAREALEVPPELMQTLQQCIDEGASVHQAPGAIDRILLTPEAAVLLMAHGAVPGEGWVPALLRWLEKTLHDGNALPDVDYPQTANEWLRRAVRQSITLRPDLDWLVVYKSEVSRNREVFIDRLSLRDRDVVRHLRQERVARGVPLVPLHADKSLYTQLLSDVLDEYPKHRLLWQDLGTDQVARDLLAQGADPSRIWSQNSVVSRDDPFLVRALFKDPALVQDLLDNGAIVSVRVIDNLGRALVDRQRRLLPGQDTYGALKALLDRMPADIDPDARLVEGASGRTLASVVEQVMPGVLDEWRAVHQAGSISQSTAVVDAASGQAPRRL